MTRLQLAIAAAAAALAIGTGAFHAGRMSGANDQAAAMASSNAPGSVERKVLYWHDPMVPGRRFDKPGKSPFMDMPLQPVYADDARETGVKISPLVQQNLGIRTAVVKQVDLGTSFDAVGTVQFDERQSVAVQTRTSGYLERLAVRAPMERVAKGQTLATLFAPEWLGPLNDLVSLKRSGAAPELLTAARERTRAMSIPPELVHQAEETGIAQARYTLTAPIGGVIAELGVREGVAVSPGLTLFRITGLDKVWAVVEIPEAQAVHLGRGHKVAATLQADPGQTFTATLQEILPQVDAATRTLQARMEIDNRAGKLVPGMLLRLKVTGPASPRLVVPTEAVMRTGMRAVAIVRKDDGIFEPRQVKLGVDLGDQLEIVEGLVAGDQVVASGQFLVDSEARLRSVLGAMSAAAPAATASAAEASTFVARGKVEAMDDHSVTISHGPVDELKWPAMTMSFAKPHASDFPDVKAGDDVHFEFRRNSDAYELVSVHRTGAAK